MKPKNLEKAIEELKALLNTLEMGKELDNFTSSNIEDNVRVVVYNPKKWEVNIDKKE